MKSLMIGDIAAGQSVQGIFLVQSKDVRQKKSGDPYLSLVLMDRSGEVEAKMWDNVGTVLDTFDRDDFVKVRGETQLYQNRLQMTIHHLQRVPDSEVDLADFLPASKRAPQEMLEELNGIIASMKDAHLKELLTAIFADQKVAQAFVKAPAAKAIHHAWLGGLIEHVLSMCALARFVSKHYANIDEDLVLAGVILHDIGKINELSYSRSFGYTAEGSLLGHMQIALRLIGEKLPAGFPPKLRNLLEHIILSHHGQLEFGSPKVPLFPEAMLVHVLDSLDSKMEIMRSFLERDRSLPGEFTGYNAALERSVLDKLKYLNGTQASAEPQRPAAKPPAPSKPTTLMAEKMKGLQGLFSEDS